MGLLMVSLCCLLLGGQTFAASAGYLYPRPAASTVAEQFVDILNDYVPNDGEESVEVEVEPEFVPDPYNADIDDFIPAPLVDPVPREFLENNADDESLETRARGKGGAGRNICQQSCYCGTPNVNRIVGGSQVRTNKYPWTAQLLKGRHYLRLFCGGSLINDRYVLTAAHCIHGNNDQLSTRLLQLDRSAGDPGILRKVIKNIVHPAYNPNTVANDIALLRLDSSVSLTGNMRPVCLPSVNHNFDGKSATVAGWGLTKEGGSISNNLNEVTVPILSNQQCRATRYKNKIQEVMLCAGLVHTGGKDACQGDSGGPLIVNEGRYKLAGVVSFGYGCAQANAPGVYARVSKFLDWITTNTRDACYCSG